MLGPSTIHRQCPPPSLSANTGKCLLKANWLKAAMLFKKKSHLC